MISLASWVREVSFTTGTGDIALGGPVEGYASFSSSMPSGDTWYSIVDLITGNREEGVATFDGISILVRKDIHYTFENQVVNQSNPVPINLSGNSEVACTLNTKAVQSMLSGVNTPVNILPNEPIYNLIDTVGNVYYKGWSDTPNTANPTWKILKGVENPSGVFTEYWADGNDLKDNIWDNRYSLTYI